MRLLILAISLAFTASPALGQFRQEFPQWAEQENASDQTRFGLMYDLNWDVPQNDAAGVRWKPILISAGIGLTLGFAIGWGLDEVTGDDLECIVSLTDFNGTDFNGCEPSDIFYHDRINGSLVGTGIGAAFGWLWSLAIPVPD